MECDSDSESSGESESDYDDASYIPVNTGDDVESTVQDTDVDGRHEFQLIDEQYKHMTETGECYMNTHQLLDILHQCHLNWLEFVCVLQDAMPNAGEHVLQQLLLDFAGPLLFLNLSEHDEKVVEQSRQVYLMDRRRQEKEKIDR